MQVSEIMTSHAIHITEGEPVSAAARLLRQYNIGALPVCDEQGTLRGMVTDRDIVLRCVAAESDPRRTPIEQIMTRKIKTARPGDYIEDASKSMAQSQVRRLPVVEADRLVGMLALCDMAREAHCDVEAAEALTEISQNIRRL